MTWIDEICKIVDYRYSNEEHLVTKRFTISDLKEIVIDSGNGQNWPEIYSCIESLNGLIHISKNWALTYNIWIKIVTMIPLINNEDYKILTDVNKNTTENKLISIINSLSPHAFELFIVDMLRNSKKYKRVSQSQRTRDGGVDFRAYYVDDSGEKIRLIGEVKKWNKPVPESVIDRLSAAISRERDLLRAGEISRGVIVATKGLSPVAMETARKNEIEIWDLNTITRMVNEQQLGMKKFVINALDEHYWSEYDGI